MLPRLRALNFADNCIESCPPLGQLTQLVYLNLSENELASVPALPASLMELRLDNNNISQLPLSIGKLHALQHLSATAREALSLSRALSLSIYLSIYLSLSLYLSLSPLVSLPKRGQEKRAIKLLNQENEENKQECVRY